MPLDQCGYLRVNQEALLPSVCIPNYRTAVSTRITNVGQALGQVQSMAVARYGARAECWWGGEHVTLCGWSTEQDRAALSRGSKRAGGESALDLAGLEIR